MAYKVPFRVYRTTDGRLVRHGDPEAAFLAYTAGQEVPDQEARREGLLDLDEKKRAQPRDKAAARPADKGGVPTAEPVPEAAPETPAAVVESEPVAPERAKPGPKPGLRRSRA